MNVAPRHSRGDRLDRALHALADPTRRAILRRLTDGEARVTELAEPFEISLNSVSKHIQALEGAGLVVRRRWGREHILSFNPSGLDDVGEWVAATRSFWATRLAALDDLLTHQQREDSPS